MRAATVYQYVSSYRTVVSSVIVSIACACVHDDATAAAKPEGKRDDLEEVIVTAQRREQRLIETPISIGVLSGEDLDRSSSRSVADVLNQVGGVSLIETQPGNSMISMRGVVPDENVGTSPTGYYLDELPFAFITTAQLPDANAFDLARVEVLRGPQGTLYGTNALSGVVRVLTADADVNDFEAKARLRGSETEHGGNNYASDLAINVPLIPGELAVRGAVSYAELSGFIDSSFASAARINDTKSRVYRLKATYKPSENSSVRFGFWRSDIDNDAPASGLADLTTPFTTNQPDDRVFDAYNLIGEYGWESFSLLSSTSYLDYRAATRQEFMAAPDFRLNFLNRFDLESISQEFRLSSQLQGPWQWSAGAIYKDTTEQQLQNAAPIIESAYEERLESKSYAVFGETTRSFAEGKADLTLGIRYYYDDLTSTEISAFSGRDAAPPRETDFDQVTGRTVLAYKPAETLMFYGSVATGFRSGLMQSSGVRFAAPFLPPLDPDTLVTYELGTKGSLVGESLTYNLAVYYQDWRDIQQSIVLPGAIAGRVNAGSASGVGVDAGISFRAFDGLLLEATVGWSDLTLDEDVVTNNASDVTVVLFQQGGRVNMSPEWTGSVGANYRITTGISQLDVVLSGNYAFRSRVNSRFLDGDDLLQTRSDAMSLLRASIGLQTDRWSIDLFGDNLQDSRDALTPPNVFAADTSIRQRPRTIGLQATYVY